MAGQKISSLVPVADLLGIDEIPLSRGGTTYKIAGSRFANRLDFELLSAVIDELSSYDVLGKISKPNNPEAFNFLVYNATTNTWVASAGLPLGVSRSELTSLSSLLQDLSSGTSVLSAKIEKPEDPQAYNFLVYNPTTQTWVASAGLPVISIENYTLRTDFDTLSTVVDELSGYNIPNKIDKPTTASPFNILVYNGQTQTWVASAGLPYINPATVANKIDKPENPINGDVLTYSDDFQGWISTQIASPTNTIFKPENASNFNFLVYNAVTQTWVASAGVPYVDAAAINTSLENKIAKPSTVNDGDILKYNGIYSQWEAAPLSISQDETKIDKPANPSNFNFLVYDVITSSWVASAGLPYVDPTSVNNKIVKPLVPSDKDLLVYDASTETWVASAWSDPNKVNLPNLEQTNHQDLLMFDRDTDPTNPTWKQTSLTKVLSSKITNPESKNTDDVLSWNGTQWIAKAASDQNSITKPQNPSDFNFLVYDSMTQTWVASAGLPVGIPAPSNPSNYSLLVYDSGTFSWVASSGSNVANIPLPSNSTDYDILVFNASTQTWQSSAGIPRSDSSKITDPLTKNVNDVLSWDGTSWLATAVATSIPVPSSPQNFNFLVYDSSTQAWVASAGLPLSIPVPSSPGDFNFLVYNPTTSSWVASAGLPIGIANPSSPQNFNFLVYDSSTQSWVASAGLPVGIPAPDSPGSFNVLVYNPNTSTWVASAGLPIGIPTPSSPGDFNFLVYDSTTQSWVASAGLPLNDTSKITDPTNKEANQFLKYDGSSWIASPLSNNLISNPTNPQSYNFLVYNESTTSWVASAGLPIGIPKPTIDPVGFEFLAYDPDTSSWVPSAFSTNGDPNKITAPTESAPYSFLVYDPTLLLWQASAITPILNPESKNTNDVLTYNGTEWVAIPPSTSFSLSTVSLSAEFGTFYSYVSAVKFFGDGSSLSGVVGIDSSKLPLSGGVLTGDLSGTNGFFSNTVRAAILSSTGALSASFGMFTSHVSAGRFIGNGSGLTNVTAIDTTKLPLVGGTLTGTLVGTNGTFSSTVRSAILSSAALSGVFGMFTSYVSAGKFIGDGSGLTNIAGTDSTKLPLAGGTLTGDLNGINSTFSGTTKSVTVSGVALSAEYGMFTSHVSAGKFFGDGSGLTGITGGSSDTTKLLPLSGGTLNGQLTGTDATFSGFLSSTALSASFGMFTSHVSAGKFIGDGSGLTNVTATDSTKLPLAGGTLTGDLNGTNSTFSATTKSITLSSVALSAEYGMFTSYVSAGKFIGDGSGLTNVTATDGTKLPLAGGTLTGNLNGTNGYFSSTVEAAILSSTGALSASFGMFTSHVSAGRFIGDGSGLTNITSTDSTKLPLAGGTLTGSLNGTNGYFSSTVGAAILSSTGALSASFGMFTSHVSAGRFIGNGSGLTNVTATDSTKLPLAGGTLTGDLFGTNSTFSGITKSVTMSAVELSSANIYGNSLAKIDNRSAGFTVDPLLHAGAIIKLDGGPSYNVTVSGHSGWIIGTQIILIQYGASAWGIVADTGVTVVSDGNKTTTNGQYTMCTLIYLGSNVWILGGNLA